MAYSGRVLKVEEIVVEDISVTTHKDLVLLIKEYARQGYEQSQSGTNGDFEKLWHETFHLSESESVIPPEL